MSHGKQKGTVHKALDRITCKVVDTKNSLSAMKKGGGSDGYPPPAKEDRTQPKGGGKAVADQPQRRSMSEDSTRPPLRDPPAPSTSVYHLPIPDDRKYIPWKERNAHKPGSPYPTPSASWRNNHGKAADFQGGRITSETSQAPSYAHGEPSQIQGDTRASHTTSSDSYSTGENMSLHMQPHVQQPRPQPGYRYPAEVGEQRGEVLAHRPPSGNQIGLQRSERRALNGSYQGDDTGPSRNTPMAEQRGRISAYQPPTGNQDEPQPRTAHGSYQDDDTGPSPKILMTAVTGVKEALNNFAKIFISQMKEKPVELKHLSDCIRKDADVEIARPNHWKFLVQAYICRRLFFGFDDPLYGISGTAEYTKIECFQQFRAHRNKADTISRLLANSSDNNSFLDVFCFQKFESILDPSTEKLFFGHHHHREAIKNRQHSDTNFYRSFLKVAVSCWLLHRLRFSFEQNFAVLNPRRDEVFKRKFMEPVVPGTCDEDDDENDHNLAVGFTVLPGFQVSESIVKSEVYLVSEAHSDMEDYPPHDKRTEENPINGDRPIGSVLGSVQVTGSINEGVDYVDDGIVDEGVNYMGNGDSAKRDSSSTLDQTETSETDDFNSDDEFPSNNIVTRTEDNGAGCPPHDQQGGEDSSTAMPHAAAGSGHGDHASSQFIVSSCLSPRYNGDSYVRPGNQEGEKISSGSMSRGSNGVQAHVAQTSYHDAADTFNNDGCVPVDVVAKSNVKEVRNTSSHGSNEKADEDPRSTSQGSHKAHRSHSASPASRGARGIQSLSTEADLGKRPGYAKDTSQSTSRRKKSTPKTGRDVKQT